MTYDIKITRNALSRNVHICENYEEPPKILEIIDYWTFLGFFLIQATKHHEKD